MSLPGNRIPDDALPEHPNHVPAQDADVLPVYCRHSIAWRWDPEEGGYVCEDDGHYDGPTPTLPGAIDPVCQPVFAHPPNEAQQRALDAEDILAAGEAIRGRVEDMRRAW